MDKVTIRPIEDSTILSAQDITIRPEKDNNSCNLVAGARERHLFKSMLQVMSTSSHCRFKNTVTATVMGVTVDE